MSPRISWEGVFPAVTTQFNDDLSLNIDATAKVMDGLIRDGVSGLIVCGSVGENTSLERKEKIAIMETAKSVAAGRVPVLCGIAEFTTAFAVETAKEAARVGIDGVMVMPALVYSSKPHETAAHFRSVATATDLPVMLYNNPPIYKNDVTPDILATLADVETVVCFKDSSGDTRRFIDTRNMVGDRFVLFAGLDDVIVESVAMGAVGWVSGMSNAFPREGETLFRLAKAGRYAEAMPLYEWFMPLLHLDARPDLVQCIKLCEHIMGRGTALTRPPRLALLPHEKAEVEAMMAKALKNRPMLAECRTEGRVSGLLRGPHLRIQRRRDAADRRTADQPAHDIGRRDQFWHIDAGRNAHALEHVDDILGRDVPRRTGGIGATAEAAGGGIDHAAALFHPGIEIGERLPIGVVEMHGEIGHRHIARHRAQQMPRLQGRADADGVAERDFVAAEVPQHFCDIDHRLRLDLALIGTAEHGGDVAADPHAVRLGANQHRLEPVDRFRDRAIDIGA